MFKILEKLTAKNKKQDDIRMPSHLSAAEQKQVQTVIDRARGDRTVPHSAQESIPFQRMFPDGICRVTDNYYTKTIQFQDINYQLAQQEDQTAIFEEWCSFLNFFDSSIRFELSFMNMATDASNFEKMVRIPYQKDHFNPVRTEYSTMLRRQLAQGNNGLTKTKYLTFGIEAESMKQAKPRLIHIEIDLMNNFKRLGVRAKLLNGKERLHLMHDMFHMGDHDRFNFDWKWLPESGLSVKDFIAPTGFAFPKNRVFQMGGMYGSMSYLQITASDLSDQLLKDFLDMESSQIVTMHIQSVDQNKAIKSIKHTITELDRSKIEEQKKAVRSGYDMDIIPSDLATYGKDAKALLKELQSQNERMFLLTFLVMNTGETEQELETNVFQASSIAQKYNCNLRRLDFQQEQGLMSCLPLAQNLIEIQRSMTTSSTAIFVPFTTQELFQTGKEALYYGLNALSNNLIMVDRKKLKNPNGLILGTPGSGKSFSAKREIANAFLVTDDDVIVCDPEAIHTFLPNKDEWTNIKNRIITENEHVKILTRISVDISIKDQMVSFSLPDFALTNAETIIEPDVWAECKDELVKGNEIWGVVELGYRLPSTSPKLPGKIKLVSFTDFCPYTVDLDYYKELRAEFDIHEWIDILLGAIDYNASGYADENQKRAVLTRLLPFVEKRLNLIELAPPGTGKSYIFGSISKYGNLSAGYMTRAKLFYDLSKRQPGLVYNNDYVAFDEVHKLRFQDEKQMGGSLQTYMENGKVSIPGHDGTADAGMILLGNIEKKDMDETMPMFDKLPALFHDSAMVDRFHGFIKGWDIPPMTNAMKISGWGLNSEYFCTIMHLLREDPSYRVIVDKLVEVPGDAYIRHVEAVKRVTTAYLKLFFPHVRSAQDVNVREFTKYCLRPAIEMRKNIWRQLAIMDPAQYRKEDREMPVFTVRELSNEN